MTMLARGRGIAQRVFVAGLLALAGSACGAPPAPQDAASLGLPVVERPAEATRGAPRAFLGAATGALTISDAKGTPLRAVAGAPLLADDKLVLGDDGLAVLIFTNGNVLRLEGPMEQALQGLAGFDAEPVSDGLEAQLVAALSDRDRERLGASSERIGGWQLRLKALEAPAPEASQPAPDPAPSPGDDGVKREEPGDPAAQDAKETPTAGDEPANYAGGPPSELVGMGNTSSESPPQGGLGHGGGKEKKNAGAGTRNTGSSSTPKPEAKPASDHPGAGRGTPRGDEDADVEPESTVQGSVHAPLTLRGRTWIKSGAKVPVSDDLSQRIAACLRPLPGDYVLVELTLSAGTITAIALPKNRSECVQSFVGEALAGVSESGAVRLTFERE